MHFGGFFPLVLLLLPIFCQCILVTSLNKACCHGCITKACITKANTRFSFDCWHAHPPNIPTIYCHEHQVIVFGAVITRGGPCFLGSQQNHGQRGGAFLLSSYLVVVRITRHNLCSFFVAGVLGKKLTHACGKHPPCHFYQWV